MMKALVAKSYQNLEQFGEAYEVKGKMYIKVKLGNGNLKQVRAYSPKEYERYYGEKVDKTLIDPFYKTQKEVLGFKDGYITIFKGDTYPHKEYLKEHGAKFTRFWGWSFGSDLEVPTDLPAGIEPIRLDWENVGLEDTLKPEEQVKAYIESLVYEDDGCEYFGTIGERVEIKVTVESAVTFDGSYGTSICYNFKDDTNHTFIWFTSTTTKTKFVPGEEVTIKCTIKDYKFRKGIHQTMLTRVNRCK